MATDCCPKTFTGFCLDDGIPIAVTLDNGVFISWTDITTGVKTFGPPPPGVVVCGGSVSPISLDCATDSITICVEDTLPVSGTVALDAATLAALETITVLQGTSPWVVDTNFDYPEDSIHVSGDIGAFVLAVRNDAGTPLAADGDYIPFTTDATGALRVNATFTGDISVALDCATDSVTICPGIDPIDVTGTVTVNQGTSPWVVSGTVSVTEPVTVDAVDLDIRDLVFATDKIDVSGSIITIQEPLSVDDNGGSLTIDGTIELGATTLAALESITVQNGAGASAVNIQDGGNSITVDGIVSGTGTFTTKEVRSATSGQTSVASSLTNVTILASNVNRLGATVFNDSTSNLFLKLGATASATSFTVKMAAGSYYEVPFNYTGIIDGLWDVVNGSARVTELTA